MDEKKALTEEELARQQEILQHLVNVAFEHGLVKAINEARIMKDPYILDAFHDLLVDKLYQELINRDKLKEL